MPTQNNGFSKNLKKPEARHRYLHVPKDERGFFPESHKTFKLEFDRKTFEMKVNHKDDIMTGQLYARHKFQENDRIIITKKKNGTYVLDAPDTKLYQKVK